MSWHLSSLALCGTISEPKKTRIQTHPASTAPYTLPVPSAVRTTPLSHPARGIWHVLSMPEDALEQASSLVSVSVFISGDNRNSHHTGLLQALNEIMGKASSSSWPRRSCVPQAFVRPLCSLTSPMSLCGLNSPIKSLISQSRKLCFPKS